MRRLQTIIMTVCAIFGPPACLAFSYLAAQRENWTLFAGILAMGIIFISYSTSLFFIRRLDFKFQEIEKLITQRMEGRVEEKEQE